MLLIRKPSISMGHLYHGYVSLPEGNCTVIGAGLGFGLPHCHQAIGMQDDLTTSFIDLSLGYPKGAINGSP